MNSNDFLLTFYWLTRFLCPINCEKKMLFFNFDSITFFNIFYLNLYYSIVKI
jgi:hypothetical protein